MRSHVLLPKWPLFWSHSWSLNHRDTLCSRQGCRSSSWNVTLLLLRLVEHPRALALCNGPSLEDQCRSHIAAPGHSVTKKLGSSAPCVPSVFLWCQWYLCISPVFLALGPGVTLVDCPLPALVTAAAKTCISLALLSSRLQFREAVLLIAQYY